MFITGIGILSLDENPALHRAWAMETLPGLTLRERSTGGQKLSGCDFVVASLERPMHQKRQGSLCNHNGITLPKPQGNACPWGTERKVEPMRCDQRSDYV